MIFNRHDYLTCLSALTGGVLGPRGRSPATGPALPVVSHFEFLDGSRLTVERGPAGSDRCRFSPAGGSPSGFLPLTTPAAWSAAADLLDGVVDPVAAALAAALRSRGRTLSYAG